MNRVKILFIDDHTQTTSVSEDHECPEPKQLTQSELILIESIEIKQNMTLTGRFLTMHKRRRKKLTTRSLSPDLAPALLDDIHHGLVQVKTNVYCYRVSLN